MSAWVQMGLLDGSGASICVAVPDSDVVQLRHTDRQEWMPVEKPRSELNITQEQANAICSCSSHCYANVVDQWRCECCWSYGKWHVDQQSDYDDVSGATGSRTCRSSAHYTRCAARAHIRSR